MRWCHIPSEETGTKFLIESGAPGRLLEAALEFSFSKEKV